MEFKNTTENNDNRVNIIDQSPQRVPQEMKLNNNNRKFELIVIFTSLIIFLAFLAILDKGKVAEKIFNKETVNLEGLKVKKFSSEAEFKEYLSKSTSSSNYFGSFSAQRNIGLPLSEGFGESVVPGGTLKTDMPAVPERVSETNVQVAGIDEPDIVKTDGVNIYFSNTFGRTYPLNVIDMGISQEEDGMFTYPLYNTKVIKAFPPEEIKTLSNISENGEMLLFDDVLVTLSGNKFSGYDINDPGNPDRKWVQELEGNTQIEAARKFENKLYLIAQTYVYNTSPCPIPLIKNGMSITCTDIYYPPIGNSTDTTYTILIVNPDDGSIDNEATFLGKSGITVTYMSENYIYVSFTYYESYTEFILGFLRTDGKDFIPVEVIEKLEKLSGYDIGDDSKMNEFTRILENYMASLSDDEKKKLENEMQNSTENYIKEHARDLEKTGIARFDSKNLKVTSSEAIPGTPLNQFSLDEYKGNLRIATTTSNSFSGTSETFNDVYVMDSDLRITGSIIDLGLTERIYSARFVEDMGYIVTFRRTDPFYVLDLSDPKNPLKAGELKIPGYSSYLHPIDKNLIMGVGMEGSNVKVSLFNVSDSSNPKEMSKYDLAEYWSDVSSNHHAFLQDEKHSIIFLPAGQNGYIFSYKNNSINLEKVLTGLVAKRALYLDDYLYVLGDAKMVVLNEKNWEEVARYDYQ